MMATKDKWTRPSLWADTLALALLAAVTWVSAGFLLGDDVFAYGDHPGHYWVMWYTLNIAAPLHHRLIDWIPYWYAGYPELQFTPPGYVLLGWLLNVILLGKASTAMIYEAVTFVGYALPGLTFYYALRHLRFSAHGAFLAGLSALVLPAFFDGATALFIGMVGSRIGLALSALVLVWTIDWLEGRGARYGWLAILALAAVILAHPYHVIGVLLALGLYVLVRRLPTVRAGSRVLIVIVSAVALDAFWLAPLFAHSSTGMIPVIRSTLDQTWRIMTDAWLLPYVLLALPTLVVLRKERDLGKRAVVLVLLAIPFLVAGIMLGTHVVLINQFHIYQLDPVRMIGEYYLAWIGSPPSA